MTATSPSRFWLFHAVCPLVFFILLAFLFENANLDLFCSDYFFDFQRQAWKFKDSWWAEGLIHLQGRKLAECLLPAPLAFWILSFVLEKARPLRRPALYLVLTIGLGTGSVALAKEVVNRHCPWDYDRYGGGVPYGRLFDSAPACCPKGRCFPAGHASAGFSLMSGYFIFYRRNQRSALALLALGLIVGSLFGFGQVARGAHFVSHNLWSLAFCWFVGLGLYAGPFSRNVFPSETEIRREERGLTLHVNRQRAGERSSNRKKRERALSPLLSPTVLIPTGADLAKAKEKKEKDHELPE